MKREWGVCVWGGERESERERKRATTTYTHTHTHKRERERGGERREEESPLETNNKLSCSNQVLTGL